MKNIFKFVFFISINILFLGCAKPPELPEMTPTTGVKTSSANALKELNTILEVYLPLDYKTTFYYIKPITDATGLSSTGEIPMSITSLVKEALSQVYYKVRTVEQYEESDVIHAQVENFLINSKKITSAAAMAFRPNADFRIEGSISQFDRALESTSNSGSGSGNFGGGQGYTSIAASMANTTRTSRIAISFSVYTKQGISIPGKYSASMEVYYAKDGKDLGFSIGGFSFGFGTEATAMHGRHMALQMLSEIAVTQIIGRTLGLPYWRTLQGTNIFQEDDIIINDWKIQYDGLIKSSLLLPFMQSQCIANGDDSVQVTGILDDATQKSLQYFANTYGVKESFDSFEMYKALELNRQLDTNISKKAWMAYQNFKNGAMPASSPAPAAVHPPQPKRSQPQPQPALAPVRQNSVPPAVHQAPPSPNYEKTLEGLL